MESFVFYKSWADMVSNFDNDVRLRFFDAIMNYACCGVIPEFSDKWEQVFFNIVRRDIDRNVERYRITLERREEAKRRRAEERRAEERRAKAQE